MASARDDAYERNSLEPLRSAKIRFEELSTKQMKKRWPQINFAEVDWGIFEPDCGYLNARDSCKAVVDAFVAGGGEYRQIPISPVGLGTSLLDGVVLLGHDTCRLKADFYVFACGPWMGELFPSIIGKLIQPTKQEVLFFGIPRRQGEYFTDQHLPVWGDHREPFMYGIPGSGRRGFKIADDTRGPTFDPTSGERIVSLETVNNVREYLAFRFPALKNAPLIESRVCQYEQTPDSHFIVDRHPENEKVWLLGGGSGHGFKHGPALGEVMAEAILKDREPARIWSLARFRKTP
jgi:glycine/D-amino acid oxidase-like deaminating enzyme